MMMITLTLMAMMVMLLQRGLQISIINMHSVAEHLDTGKKAKKEFSCMA